MGIRDLIRKKDQLDGGAGGGAVDRETLDRLAGPEFTFIRSDTHTQEIIHPPSHPHEPSGNSSNNFLSTKDAAGGSSTSKARRSLDVFKTRSRGSSTSSVQSADGSKKEGHTHTHRRLSQRLHLSRAPSTSEFVPEDLPQINVYAAEGLGSNNSRLRQGMTTTPAAVVVDRDAYEGQWEKRATILAEANERGQRRTSRSPSVVSGSPAASPSAELPSLQLQQQNDDRHLYNDDHSSSRSSPLRPAATRARTDGVVSSKAIDEQIQEAIRLHEDGQLDQSTRLFGRLADPQGANNPLSQVLYGLALRHGWGCEPDPERAVTYLSAAASNAAAVESMALQAGLKKGGAAKGELVLAIFELANCFRHGWGIPRDPVAAKQYYETAANLGDTDAMNEVGWCYLEGFGCKKDKFASARYYRLAEENGNKTLGNTWIWKDKYNPTNPKKK
ncbi:HCP-like protein [Hypoxylon sp. FL1150]|nr:HCP-like protein [Hypoxylon sp. FL1150]